KIVVVGQAIGASGSTDFAVVRYNSNGTVDSSVITNFGGSSFDTAFGVVVDAAGNIVVAGYSTVNATGNNDFAVARYHSDLSLDTSFDGDGMATVGFGGTADNAYALALQADGKIVLAGSSNAGSTGNDFAAARFNSNGTLDTGFGTGGLVTID